MTKLLPLFFLVFAGFVFSQTTERAVPTYSVNDKLIGLSNLYGGLSECAVRSVSGKVRDIDRYPDRTEVTVRVDKKTRVKVVIPLDRVADTDRRAVFRHLITKNNTIRASGYACNPDEPFSAFSVDRVY